MGQDLILSSKFVKLHKKLHLLYNCITFIVLKIVFMIIYLPVDAGMYKIQNLLMYSNQAKHHNKLFIYSDHICRGV